MTLAAAAMLKLGHRHARLSPSKGVNGICDGVRTIREDGPIKYQEESIIHPIGRE
ncbi:hypothetical protein KIN20_010170 [Parelaphostrongylus tenuis]|uniref:Uncharacterized protein n=1 Tax=Parelaphostrongylus tenuis TaxID=148309 RepID=A0AAD5QL84_PARTN|nr:hypothetical protein KIN20_010170 [Parelaphostrongylus tenuis]